MADETPPVTPSEPWYAALDAEHQGHLQNKGWDKLDPAAAALELTKAWKGAEKMVGIPKDELLRLPKAGDVEAEKAFWNRLGAKEKPEEYDFSNLKFKDAQTLDEEFVGVVRSAAHELHLPADKASAFVHRIMGHMDTVEAGEAAQAAATKSLEVEKLTASWGPNMEMNTFVAQQAATKLGVAPEAITALEGVVGYSNVMEMFRRLGSQMGEGRFIENEGGKPAPAMTYEMAIAEKAELMADHVFCKNWRDNGPNSPERVKMTNLDRLIASNPNHFRR
jgi:hypothetical protein